MNSKFFVYESPDGLDLSGEFMRVETRKIYFEDRDDVYDFLDELISLGIISCYPNSVWLHLVVYKGIDVIFIGGNRNYAISKNRLSRSRGRLIASPGGDGNDQLDVSLKPVT